MRGAKEERRAHSSWEFCLLGEEDSSYGDEISCMRFLGGGRLLSLWEAWSSLLHYFTGAILLQRGAHEFGRLILSW
jgi:hypothetical protein